MRTPSPTRVAFRSLIAGGSDFQNFGKGTDPKAVFRTLVENARYESGRGGYSGTIAEKSDFELRSRTPMSRQQAREFLDRDLGHNDKWGPAFAVPIAEVKVKSEKEVTVKVSAPTQQEAWKLAEAEVKAKAGDKAVEISRLKATKIKEGGLPEMAASTSSEKLYRIEWGRGGGQLMGVGPTKKDVIDSFKQKLLKDEYLLSLLKPGTMFTLYEVKGLKTFTVAGWASKSPVWEISFKVRVVEVGGVEGYLFYGIASD
jgi:hypothetical protein